MHEEVIIAETSQSHLSSALNPSLLKMGPLVITTVGAIAATGTIIGASIAIGILTVTTTKSPPTCISDRYTTYKSSKYLLDVLYNDYDIKGSNLYVKSVLQPIDGRGIIRGNSTVFGNRIQYTSDLTYGNITFNYTVTNGWLDSTCEVFIDQKNNKPEAKDFSISIPKNRPYMIDVSRHVRDVDGDSLFLLNPTNNSLLFQYPGSPVGIYIRDYTVSDGIDQASARITINTYNMRPKALGSNFLLPKDYMYDLPISMNDYDPDGDKFTIVDVYNICPDANVFLQEDSLVRFVPTRNNILILNGCPFQYTISDGSDISTGMAFVRLMNQKPQIISKKVYVPKNTVVTIPIETLDLDPYDLVTITLAKDIVSQLDIQFLIIDELTLIIPYMNGSDTIQLNKRTYGLIVLAGIKDLNISILGTDGYDTSSGNIEVIIENSKPVCHNYTLICIKGNICYFDNSQLCLDPDGDTLLIVPITTSFIADSNTTITVLATDVMGAMDLSQLLIIVVDPPHIKIKPLCHNSSILADRSELILLSKLLNITADGTYIIQKDGDQISDIIQVPYYPGNHSWQITISDGSLLNMCIILIYIPNNSPSCLSLNIQIPYNPQGTNIVIDTHASDPDNDPIVLLYSTPYCLLNSNTLLCKIYTSTNIPITVQDMYGATGLCIMSITTILVPPVAMDDLGLKEQLSLSIIYTADLMNNDYDPAGFPVQFNNTWFQQNGCSCVGCCDTNSGSKPVLDSTGKVITFYPNTDRCGTMKFQYRIDRVGNQGSAIATATYKIINCQCKKPMDIVLVWDGSGSISSSSWKSMKSFATNLASKMTISPSLVRMAVVQFSSSVYIDTPYGFGFQSDSTTLNSYLSNMKLRGGSTNIRHGLSIALIWLLNSTRLVDKTIVLITDGDSNQPTDCAGCDLITTMGMSGSDWCSLRILNSTGKLYTCSKCDDYPRSCVDPTPQRLIIKNLGINLVALGIGDSISSVGLQDLVVLNGGSLLSVSWNSLDTIYSLIADLSCT